MAPILSLCSRIRTPSHAAPSLAHALCRLSSYSLFAVAAAACEACFGFSSSSQIHQVILKLDSCLRAHAVEAAEALLSPIRLFVVGGCRASACVATPRYRMPPSNVPQLLSGAAIYR
jgi:hypothetical protein